MCLLPAIVSFARALSYLASPSPVCLFVALIGQQWQQQRVRSCGTSGLTATTANLTLAIPAFDTSSPPFLFTYQPRPLTRTTLPLPSVPTLSWQPCCARRVAAGWRCWVCWRVAQWSQLRLCPGFTGRPLLLTPGCARLPEPAKGGREGGLPQVCQPQPTTTQSNSNSTPSTQP